MRFSLILSLILATTSLLASVDTRLSNNHFAYYGSEFYSNFPKNVTKDLLFRIMSGSHNSNPKTYDTLTCQCKSDCYAHVAVGYTQARKILFGELYVQSDSTGKFVEDVYCGKKFYFHHVDDVSSMGNTVNIEHTWPQSKFSGRFQKDLQKSDLHHLYPTDSDANNKRGNFRFGSVNENEDQLNVENCESSRLGHPKGEMVFTPPTKHRGNVARALFYFATRYQMEITPAEEAVLREWHKSDPVDATERKHHETIAKHQQVRNPFIDYPELADKIGDL